MVSQMESQHADANEELLLELKSKNTTRSVKDFSPEGIRLESNLEGEAKGVYNATFYATITMLVKPDRTIDYEVRQIHTTSDGDTVLVYYKGKSIIERVRLQGIVRRLSTGAIRNRARSRDRRTARRKARSAQVRREKRRLRADVRS